MHRIYLSCIKRYYLIVLLGLLILSLSSVSATLTPTPPNSTCYQEYANVSTSCGGLNIGLYYVERPALWRSGKPYYFYDGSWSTYTFSQNSTATEYFYVNYSKPLNANNFPLWQGRTSYVSSNFSITSDCWNYSNTILSLRVGSNLATLSNYWECKNSSGWKSLGSIGGTYGHHIEEDAVIWNVSSLVENTQTWNNNSYSTMSEEFILNVTYNADYYNNILATLYYNGDAYYSTKTSSYSQALFNTSITIPEVNSITNYSFYWNILVYNGTSVESYNTSLINQTVRNSTLSSCSASYPVKAYNFTIYDEKNLSRIYNHDFFGTFNYGITSRTNELLIENNNVNETTVCINPNITMYVDAEIEYSLNSNYVIRDFFLINNASNSTVQNINLYLLPVVDSTTFIIKVQDINLLPLDDVYVLIERYYPATDSYKIVQIVRTDESGKSVAFYEAENTYYRHTIMDSDGNVLYQTVKQKVFPEQVPYTLTFTIGESIDNPISDFIEDEYVNGTITFNNNTKIITLSYIDSSSDFELGRLYVEKNGWSSNDLMICNSNSTLPTAIITCDLSAYNDGSFNAKFYVTRDGIEKLIEITTVEISDVVQTMGREGLFLAWFIIMTAGLIFLGNIIAGIWAVNMAVIFTNLIGLAKFNPVYIFGMIAISIILTIVLKE